MEPRSPYWHSKSFTPKLSLATHQPYLNVVLSNFVVLCIHCHHPPSILETQSLLPLSSGPWNLPFYIQSPALEQSWRPHPNRINCALCGLCHRMTPVASCPQCPCILPGSLHFECGITSHCMFMTCLAFVCLPNSLWITLLRTQTCQRCPEYKILENKCILRLAPLTKKCELGA